MGFAGSHLNLLEIGFLIFFQHLGPSSGHYSAEKTIPFFSKSLYLWPHWSHPQPPRPGHSSPFDHSIKVFFIYFFAIILVNIFKDYITLKFYEKLKLYSEIIESSGSVSEKMLQIIIL